MPRQDFQLYNATVRLGGESRNAIPRRKITAPEIALLLAIHGQDAIEPRSIIRLGGKDEFARKDSFELRAELAEKYKTANVDGQGLLAMTFGTLGPLPTSVEEVMPGLGSEEIADQETLEDQEALQKLMQQPVNVNEHMKPAAENPGAESDEQPDLS